MNGLIERRHTDQTLEQRAAYIKGLCDQATATGLGGGHSGKQIFDTLDYTKLAKYSRATNDGVCDGEAMMPGEISDAVISAVDEQTFLRKKGGFKTGLVNTNHILFQFYLIKKILHKAAQ
ncbi:hypothetical protein A2833_01205 [Candidatus Azambacteria bacterium RIFCSPHIGHO2_01_FULL_44_55]|uniref:Uncharacterized protein n=1 Tax=Candidatus Azambacteria bacterium RIFCSPLOWO2_02_FULL_44_14 TaxID=1797306 RepID=A0A1F5CCG0_9BACT|nr:MAG: hypothetical protein A3A18_00955 [Candidatus Azambacteria bacterium RIFCSPLOWO2_01_FULL_44_84]OGD32888.1 MAG: hypothetical protein A3C78_00990 [Candidatus Azambacteria bacterium RIFCSPHIGHO2_02_FULL_45_18]OGD40543.1 MAG: hypothetical protein A3I30_01845 [Candidatus Azambacteria bacterium RIFCSPLOWO2_02_FULL_44_14]OGD40902.1 MAG: hypothetical protein A2833_01205 [Candidatus Azambacteria bacterium RIFCSPHIGHO2_01_FULL_44_55]OGD52270.1 MAG: hypothetical protein A2608_02855 [Candidatus Azam